MNAKQTPDDALQPQSDIFNVTKDEPHLAEDDGTPSSPATDTGSRKLPMDDPRTDYASEIDRTELFDEGLTSATETDTWEDDSRPKGSKIS